MRSEVPVAPFPRFPASPRCPATSPRALPGLRRQQQTSRRPARTLRPARPAPLPSPRARARAQGPRDSRSRGPTARCCASHPEPGFGPGPLIHPTTARPKSWCVLRAAAPTGPDTRQGKHRRHSRLPLRPSPRPERLLHRAADQTKWPPRGRPPSLPCGAGTRPGPGGGGRGLQAGRDSAPVPGRAPGPAARAPGLLWLFPPRREPRRSDAAGG